MAQIATLKKGNLRQSSRWPHNEKDQMPMFLRTIYATVAAVALCTIGTVGAAQAAGMMIVHHVVADYAKWRPGFDNDKSNQEAAGLTNPHVYQSVDNSKDITITFDMADAAKAKAFATSKTLKATMTKLGVKGKPQISFLNAAPSSFPVPAPPPPGDPTQH